MREKNFQILPHVVTISVFVSYGYIFVFVYSSGVLN